MTSPDLKRIMLEHETQRLQEIVAPYRNDPLAFARDLNLTLNATQIRVLLGIQAVAHGGQTGFTSEEVPCRAIVLGALWWLLREPGSFVVFGVPGLGRAGWITKLAHAFCHDTSPALAEFVEFRPWLRVRVAGRAGWGYQILVDPDEHQPDRRHSPRIAAVEFGANRLKRPIALPDRLDAVRISTWDPVET